MRYSLLLMYFCADDELNYINFESCWCGLNNKASELLCNNSSVFFSLSLSLSLGRSLYSARFSFPSTSREKEQCGFSTNTQLCFFHNARIKTILNSHLYVECAKQVLNVVKINRFSFSWNVEIQFFFASHKKMDGSEFFIATRKFQ